MEDELFRAAPSERLSLAEPWLDAGHGRCGLTDEDAASAIAASILAAPQPPSRAYQLLAWCIMPSHVHALIIPRRGADLIEIVGAWMHGDGVESKTMRISARGNWSRRIFALELQDDSCVAQAARYIEHNPVGAGLVASPCQWRWSSAASGALFRRLFFCSAGVRGRCALAPRRPGSWADLS
jgi:REP element-mobilizing transposase RayT